MPTTQSNHKLFFNYLKTSLPDTEVAINHPLVNNDLTRGILIILPLNDALAGRYISEEVQGVDFQITTYHQNFAEINKLDAKVRECILNFEYQNLGNIKITRQLYPKFIGNISLWQSVMIIRWYFDSGKV
jgi:hypothetical protein